MCRVRGKTPINQPCTVPTLSLASHFGLIPKILIDTRVLESVQQGEQPNWSVAYHNVPYQDRLGISETVQPSRY